jgi:UDP-N-acetylmuramate dehydrogenase
VSRKADDVPGCIRGAICITAGSHEQTISDDLISIETLDSSGNTHQIEKDAFKFSDRNASVPRGHVRVSATFRFKEQGSKEYFELVAEEFLNWRKIHQPKGINFGSVFKNGKDFHAGELSKKAGLKGITIENAVISNESENFIINHGNESSRDIEKLIDLIRFTVHDPSGRFLQTDVQILRA